MIAYNTTSLRNLFLIKETRRWRSSEIIPKEQLETISQAHPVTFYHPNFIIRILLFLATLVALAGVTGLTALLFEDILSDAVEYICVAYGLASWAFLEAVFIKHSRHYKSGVNEAMLYHSIGWTVGGITALSDFNEHVVIVTLLVFLVIASIRYADLLCTLGAFASFAYLVFYEMYTAGGIFEQIIPILFIAVFAPVYFLARWQRKKEAMEPWEDCLVLVESLALLTVYAAGNYFIVREVSVNMLDLYLEPDDDIPLAWLFYALTIIIPIAYLYSGIRTKNIVLLRVSLVALAFSVFTFKYYFSLGHPEITLTLAGAVLMIISLYLFRLLRSPLNGYTRENVLEEKWASANPEAFVISQTLGGNKMPEQPSGDYGQGGSMGGAGSTDSL